jgi:hypothetical protein
MFSVIMGKSCGISMVAYKYALFRELHALNAVEMH